MNFLLYLFAGFLLILDQNPSVEWESTQKLSWNDFQGQAPADYDPSIFANTTSDVTYSFASAGTDLQFETQTLFIQDRSWLRPGKGSDVLLKHEQYHFHLAEYQRRVLAELLQTTKFKSVNTIVDEITALNLRAFEMVDKIQDEYDRETDHSRVADKQKEWERKIDKMLEAKKEFADKQFSVDIKYLL